MLTKAELAQDALKHLKSGRFIPTCGVYWELPSEDLFDKYLYEDAKEILNNEEHCQVCIQGAFLLVAIDRKNELKLRDFRFSDTEKMSEYIEAFTVTELLEMESVFERIWERYDIVNEGMNKFIEPDEKFSNYIRSLRYGCYGASKFDTYDRMKRILEHVIKYNKFDRNKFMEDNPSQSTG